MSGPLGEAIDIPLDATLNTDTVSYDVNELAKGQPRNLINNGIARDGGLSEVYNYNSQTSPPTNGILIKYTSTGKRIELSQDSSNNTQCSVDGKLIYQNKCPIFQKYSEITGYSDAVVNTADNTIYAVKYITSPPSSSSLFTYVLDHLNFDGSIISTVTKTVTLSSGLALNPNITISRLWPTLNYSFSNIFICVASMWSSGSAFLINNASTIYTYAFSGPNLYTVSNDVLYAYMDPSNTKTIFHKTNRNIGGGVVYTSTLLGGVTAAAPFSGCQYVTPVYGSSNYCLVLNKSLSAANGYAAAYAMSTSSWGTFVALTTSDITSPVIVDGKGTCNQLQYTAHYTGTGVTDSIGIGATYDSSQGPTIYFKRSSGINSFDPDFISQTYLIKVCNILGFPSYYTIGLSINGGRGLINGQMISDYGDIDYVHQPFFSTNDVNQYNYYFMYKTQRNTFIVVKYGTPSFCTGANIREFSPGVINIPVADDTNIIDTNNMVQSFNYGSFSTTHFAPIVSSTGSNSVNYFQSNQYSSMIDFGKIYNGISFTAATYSTATGLSFVTIDDIELFVDSKGYACSFGKNPSTLNGNGFMKQAIVDNPPVSYVTSSYLPVSGIDEYDYRTGLSLMSNGSAVVKPEMLSYQLTNFLTQTYTAAFRLFGQLYTFNGAYIYNLPLSSGSDGQVGTPNIVALANGLTFLCVTPHMAIFKSDYDNSLFGFDGGRSVEKFMTFNQKPTIRAAAYNTRNDEIVLLCANSSTYSLTDSLIFIRSGIASEIYTSILSVSTYPYTSYQLQESKDATWIINNTIGAYTSFYYKKITSSTVVPLSWTSAYYGLGNNMRNRINRIVFRLVYTGLSASAVSLAWNWMTQDSTGTNTAIITPTIDANGYAIIDWVPPNAAVLAGSIGFSTSDTTQKIVLLSVTAYIAPEADAQTLNHAI